MPHKHSVNVIFSGVVAGETIAAPPPLDSGLSENFLILSKSCKNAFGMEIPHFGLGKLGAKLHF